MRTRSVKLASSLALVLAACGTHDERTPVAAPSQGPTASAPVPPAAPAIVESTAPHGAEISIVAATEQADAAMTIDLRNSVRLWPTLDGSKTPVPIRVAGEVAQAVEHDRRSESTARPARNLRHDREQPHDIERERHEDDREREHGRDAESNIRQIEHSEDPAHAEHESGRRAEEKRSPDVGTAGSGDAQPRDQEQPREQNYRERAPQPQFQPQPNVEGGVDRLPSFITGQQPQPNGNGFEANGNGHQGGERFPPRRRRRPHGPRPDNAAAAPAVPSEDFNPGNE